MDKKQHLSQITIKQETTSPTAKKVLLSNSSFASLSNKSISNARLPSFKPPRDLFLTGSVTPTTHSTFNFNTTTKSTRKTFAPNVNVTRKKPSSDVLGSATKTDTAQPKHKEKDKSKPLFSRKNNSNLLQTKGVFSEGLAPSRIKPFSNSSAERPSSDPYVLHKPKLNLNKKIHKTDEDTKLSSLLKDNFLDDPSQIPDITFIPRCLPMIYNVSNSDNLEDLEKTFDTLQVKSEKNFHEINLKSAKPILKTELESNNQSPKVFLFEFPSVIMNQRENDCNKKKNIKQSSGHADQEQVKSEGLSSLGEGFFGHLRVHENGKAFLVSGKSVFPIHVDKHSNKQEVMSTSVNCDTMKGEVICLGSIDANIICSANIFGDVR